MPRAKAGIFLAFQYPESIEGVSVTFQFLRQAMAARKGTDDLGPSRWCASSS